MDDFEVATDEDILAGIRATEARLGSTFEQWREYACTDDFPDLHTRLAWYAYGDFEHLLD
jgi:hypothetical protein